MVRVADAVGLTKKRAEITVDSLFGSIAEALRQGEKVELRGFGSFRLRHHGPHSARNPRTGARVDVPLKRVGSGLRQLPVEQLLQLLAGREVGDAPLTSNGWGRNPGRRHAGVPDPTRTGLISASGSRAAARAWANGSNLACT